MRKVKNNLLNNSEFRENWRSDSHALLQGVNEFLPAVSKLLKYVMFCWPCISIFSCKEKPNWCTIYFQYISSDLYKLSWLDWNPTRTTDSNL